MLTAIVAGVPADNTENQLMPARKRREDVRYEMKYGQTERRWQEVAATAVVRTRLGRL
jgi:hypothetical protein